VNKLKSNNLEQEPYPFFLMTINIQANFQVNTRMFWSKKIKFNQRIFGRLNKLFWILDEPESINNCFPILFDVLTVGVAAENWRRVHCVF